MGKGIHGHASTQPPTTAQQAGSRTHTPHGCTQANTHQHTRGLGACAHSPNIQGKGKETYAWALQNARATQGTQGTQGTQPPKHMRPLGGGAGTGRATGEQGINQAHPVR
jgi:hypothetical protein